MTLKNVCCIELSGSTASVAIAKEIGTFLWKMNDIPTYHPIPADDSVKKICDAIKSSGYDFDAIGIASFGPLNVQLGRIGNTPKTNWKHFPLIESIRKQLNTNVPIVLETDVNAPAYSEYLALNAKEPSSTQATAYLTIGAGVGLGVFADGKPFHGIMHPEFGHIMIRPIENDNFEGTCPFHKNCIEGLISSKALAKRLNINQEHLGEVPNEHRIWDLFYCYVAATAAAAAISYAVDTVVVGGSLITGDGKGFLFDKANAYCTDMVNKYIQAPRILPPAYSKDSGLVGAAAIAFHSDMFVK
ncbi:putative fructokinase [Tritrichomonas foetus]|uniref:fructokinase n=1 Tax=Tritrichomonas foetus TaxID=1144522 RepID=A0A1J4JEG0_9EUKA|nr:putative fructokinase [Tritrichomonas foetus]|eukprot:OHS97041.1 putative fructokinase [Tritrichomonas foetus]